MNPATMTRSGSNIRNPTSSSVELSLRMLRIDGSRRASFAVHYRQRRVDAGVKLDPKSLRAEARRIHSTGVAVDPYGVSFKAFDGGDNGLGRLAVVQNSGRCGLIQIDDCLVHRPALVCNHGRARGLRFDGSDAEVFERCKHERTRVTNDGGAIGVVEPSCERNVGRQIAREVTPLRSVPHNYKLPCRHATKRLNEQIYPLVGNETRNSNVWPGMCAISSQRETRCINRRVNNVGSAVIAVRDHASNML